MLFPNLMIHTKAIRKEMLHSVSQVTRPTKKLHAKISADTKLWFHMARLTGLFIAHRLGFALCSMG